MSIFKRIKDSAPAAATSPDGSASATNGAAARKAAVWNREPLAQVRKVVAIGSGKGGVGKSTTTIMLAHALAAQGLATGILDADIYGPSIPRMLGLENYGQPQLAQGRMLPPEAYGIRCNSMGFLLPADGAAIWRGPMITKALNQLARLTEWGHSAAQQPDMNTAKPLDLLLTDLPPGTGDIHLSMVQQVPLDGALLVTTPQEIALLDARKCAAMFRKVGVPILGVIENMSWLEDSRGERIALFGSGGGQKLADELQVPLLAQIPVIPGLVDALDNGKQPDAAALHYYLPVLRALL